MISITLNLEESDVPAICAAHEVEDIKRLQEWLIYEMQRKTEVYLKQQQQLNLPPIQKPIITFENKK